MVPGSLERTETITLTGRLSLASTMSVSNLANGSAGSTHAADQLIEDDASPPINGEFCTNEENNLPLVGDYVGMGGPDAVPLETQGAFEKPDHAAGNLLDELFMSPTETQLLSVHRAFRNMENAKNKSRLKTSIILHCLLGVLMALKLLPEVLDKFDIFVLEIEELFLPTPKLWEWIWMSSVIPTYLGFSACKKSKISLMNFFQVVIIVIGLLPIVVGMSYHFSDLYEVITGSGDGMITKFQGIPMAVIWYVFFFVALQIHGVQLYLSNTLIKAWQPKKSN